MVQRIGIDFGTTNSLISVVTREGKISSFDDTGRPHPSVVCYEGEQVICGRRARDKLELLGIGVLGNTVRGPKKLLGQEHVNVDGRMMTPVEVIADYISYLVEHAHAADEDQVADLTRAVVTIPVALDGRGRQDLREALLQAGVHVDTFVHEPLAALYGYFKDLNNTRDALTFHEGRMILVFDWGGGTLDLTLCKVVNGALVQILNRGNNAVGGDYLDDAILSYVTGQHAYKFGWSAESKLPTNPGMRAKLLTQCERAKITLSTREKTHIFLPDYYQGDNEDETEIDFWLTRSELEKVCTRLINQGINEIAALLGSDNADVDPQTLALCLATGGMVNMPLIKSKLTEIFGVSALHISEKGDRIISEGAAWIANDNLQLALAKPFELVEARNSLLAIIPEGTRLPQRGASIQKKQSMYCSDPRDGKAIFIFKRPQMVQKSAAADPRTTYGNLVVEVNPDFPPLGERIELTVTIDDNLILHTHAIANDRKEPAKKQFYDLEFSLVVTEQTTDEEQKKKRLNQRVDRNRPKELVVQANITIDSERWDTVPGDLLKIYNDKYIYMRKAMTPLQEQEYVRYQPCSKCGASWSVKCCQS
ncbi:Hsp70 family protein [Pseudomonas aeruginosa]|uniref:Hsp70 family protein n=1 Tax=Pseudomonas aeruginosa TaxID=287 RepID=UPI0021F11B4C|nr:Hsp70 family protein [Pseudomonas aeruginosa]MCV6104753.1 Hsp70 family protein [Pseudomonas aeruginosa]MDI2201421.1 Hsp70 family protein [Pseudomonas aeruginosa]HBO3958489.1 Hsp70 family protein [Pseudomonas aeruginosa]HCF6076481.1 Hsp70 family protein [Pseudomonas aeruginosa]HEP8278281.1 Hsp70 family protein [Pseudomonas aeruginosa]